MLGALLCTLTACHTPLLEARLEYQFISPSQDGIGKVYLGREIAHTMGHEGAAWLDRPSRVLQERPQAAIESLALQPTDVVADIGAGTGYFATRLATLVPQGRVLAVDIQPEMLAMMQERLAEQSIDNVEPVLGRGDDPNLPPGSIDLALMVDAYHEFAYPREMMQGIVAALRPGGRVVLAEYRAENPMVMIKRLHKMSEAQVKREMAAAGLTWLKTDDSLPQQHLLFFQKPA
ncbi:MAG: class I SAM-dependent methyltransferase [Leptolyngbyaceae cyanobacterium SM2_5_2]|nr:class I SAM-dependent methyltransferase [Leptolyngbyaceae cyanobacterium SM2_5_2]